MRKTKIKTTTPTNKERPSYLYSKLNSHHRNEEWVTEDEFFFEAEDI